MGLSGSAKYSLPSQLSRLQQNALSSTGSERRELNSVGWGLESKRGLGLLKNFAKEPIQCGTWLSPLAVSWAVLINWWEQQRWNHNGDQSLGNPWMTISSHHPYALHRPSPPRPLKKYIGWGAYAVTESCRWENGLLRWKNSLM